MPSAKGLIDTLLLYSLNMKSTDGNWQNFRTRAVARLQELTQLVWDFDAWDFKDVAVQITVPAAFPTLTGQPLATGFVALPTDFDIVGEHGGVYVAGQHQQLTHLEPQIFFRKKELFSEVSQLPYWFTILSQTGLNTPVLYTYPVNSVDTLLDIFYMQKRPTILDQDSLLPSAVPISVALNAVAGNLSTGAYTYVCTFIGTVPLGAGGNSASGETNPGAVSQTIGIASSNAAQVNLTNIPLGPAGTTQRNIYRTKVNGFQYFLLANIADNVTTTFTDNVADSSLGVLAPTTNALLSGLEKIPNQYHEPVMLRGMVDMMSYDIGDGRAANDAKARALAGVSMMKARRNLTVDQVWGLGDDGLRVWGMH